MRDPIPQRSEIGQLQGDAVPLNALRLENRPKVSPKMMALPTEQGTPKAEIQFSDHLTVCASLTITRKLVSGFGHTILLITGRQSLGVIHPIRATLGGELAVSDVAQSHFKHM
jgi:hypothetical protein